MRGTGRPGRGERGRVASRVRDLLSDAVAGPDGRRTDPGGAHADPDDDSAETEPWLPGDHFDVTPARHAAAATPTPPGEERGFRLPRLRWESDRRTAVAVGLAVLIAGAVTLWWVLSSRPRDVAVHASGGAPAAVSTGQPTLSASSTPSGAPGSSASGSPADLVVDVAGKVRHPGVYRLAAGSRVVDALRAAGGPLAGVSTLSLNLAEPLHDGQQVVVGVTGTASGGGAVGPASAGSGGSGSGGSGSAGGGSSGGVVDLNVATLEQLQTLPGVGPVLAQHILDWRTQHGRFDSVDQLNDVSGIGEVKFAELRPLVTV